MRWQRISKARPDPGATASQGVIGLGLDPVAGPVEPAQIPVEIAGVVMGHIPDVPVTDLTGQQPAQCFGPTASL
jgi:hypothetical protein